MKVSSALLLPLALLVPELARSAELPADALSAWENYIEDIDSRLHAAATAPRAFLRVDQNPGQAEQTRRGDVIVSQVEPRNVQKIPNGLIHDWTGTIFIPDATLDQVVAATRNYQQYPRWYGPTIAEASLVAKSGDEDRFILRYVRTVLFVTVVVEIENQANYTAVDATRGYSVTRSVHISEVHDYGKPSQRAVASDDGSGYVWRAYTISKYQQRDGGVYIEQENVVLSHPIPASFRWLVEPAVRRLAKTLLEKSLRQTREAVRSKP
jgi:hypothetical protein